jgi:PAS domain S-box-containing protein
MNADADPGPVRVLHVEDNDGDASLVQGMLESAGFRVTIRRVDGREAFVTALGNDAFDLVLSDVSLPEFDGWAALELVRNKCQDLPFVFVSGSIDEEDAIESLKRGATDYVLKHRLERLNPAVQRALQEAEERRRRRQAEATTAATQARFRTMIETLPVGVFLNDAHGLCLEANPACLRITGLSAEGIRGDVWARSVHAEDRDRVLADWETAVRNTASYVAVTRFLHPDGRVVDAEVSAIPIHEADCFVGFVGTIQDMTARRQDAERIREQAALLDKAQDAICVTDLDQRIQYWNESAERLYGWAEQEALGRCANELLFEANPAAPVQALKQLMRTGEWLGELDQITRDRRKITVESRWTLVRDGGGRPKSILVINTDLTARKLLEAQYLRAQRLESIGNLAGGIAHDLNNILAPILMASHMLQTKATDPRDRHWLETIGTSARRGADLVKQILSFARGSQGEKAILQPRHLIGELYKVLRQTLPPSIQIQCDTDKSIWTVNGDPTQIYQVLMNLSVNARDAMPHGGTLTLESENVVLDEAFAARHLDAKPDHYVRLSVRDTGQGIPAEAVDQIFDPFFTTKEPGKGTGLGLATTLTIVRNHGGFITVDSTPGEGSAFQVYLPAVGTEETNLQSGESDLPRGRGELILVVDDEVAVRDMIGATLEVCGYRPLTACDGTEAVALFVEHATEIRAVLVDSLMPLMDGAATVRTLRRLDSQVPIITVSGLNEDHEEIQRLELRGLRFLHKPFTTAALLQLLRRVLKEAGNQGDTPGNAPSSHSQAK